MSINLESTLTALVRAALADLGAGPGVLADYLEERGDRRGVLLRRRWKRWQTEARELWFVKGWADGTFRDYIRQRFDAHRGRPRRDKYDPRDVAILGGDPSS